jgi:excisionase family DNA binding protein
VSEEDNEVWLTSSEVAELLHVSPKTVSRYAKERRIPYKRTPGGHRRFPRQGVLDAEAGWQDDA